ncbi:hypothetical protein AAU61_19285 [Desulfocarbo indianensis]|nr:hypothetical protein AAU61_19285 [Desulfocarbo indianensis]
MNPKPVFCFIDDAAFELDNFRKNAASAFAGVEFVYAATFEQAQANLKERLPICFLLDIYGQDPQKENPGLPGPEVFKRVLEQNSSVGDLYTGLDQTGGDRQENGNLFLRRVHAQLESWQAAFAQACQSLGQGNSYGLANLAAVREKYPWAAALGFSRKALFRDAVAMLQAGADGVLQKPQGATDEEIAKATRLLAPELARGAFAAVDRRLAGQAAALGLGLWQDGDNLPMAEVLLQGIRQMGSSLAGEPRVSSSEAAEALAGIRLEDAGLSPAALGLVLALRRWLGREIAGN